MSEGMSADAEWQQRQTVSYSPVLGSEQGGGTADLRQSMFFGSVCLQESNLLRAYFQIKAHSDCICGNLFLINTSLLTR